MTVPSKGGGLTMMLLNHHHGEVKGQPSTVIHLRRVELLAVIDNLVYFFVDTVQGAHHFWTCVKGLLNLKYKLAQAVTNQDSDYLNKIVNLLRNGNLREGVLAGVENPNEFNAPFDLDYWRSSEMRITSYGCNNEGDRHLAMLLASYTVYLGYHLRDFENDDAFTNPATIIPVNLPVLIENVGPSGGSCCVVFPRKVTTPSTDTEPVEFEISNYEPETPEISLTKTFLTPEKYKGKDIITVEDLDEISEACRHLIEELEEDSKSPERVLKRVKVPSPRKVSPDEVDRVCEALVKELAELNEVASPFKKRDRRDESEDGDVYIQCAQSPRTPPTPAPSPVEERELGTKKSPATINLHFHMTSEVKAMKIDNSGEKLVVEISQ